MRLPEEFRERTKKFASAIIKLYAFLPRSRKEVKVLGHQLLRSGTSVAAHTREASRARSDAEFCSKIEGALQEADESQLWIGLLRDDCGIEGPALERAHQEISELIAIPATMASKTRRGLK
jgi:four helix bundle protein